MSKSKGNFFTLQQIVEMYGADATRIAFADSGDTHDDANFVQEISNKAILRLNAFESWFDEIIKSNQFRENTHIYDEIFTNTIDQHLSEAYNYYDSMKFKYVIKEI